MSDSWRLLNSSRSHHQTVPSSAGREKSKSFTYGVSYSCANFNAKADYFNIETKNAIDTNPQFVLDQFRNNELFQDKVQIDPVTNNVLTLEATALNLASRKVEGVDLAFDYALRGTPSGSYTFSLLGSHYIKYMNQADFCSRVFRRV